MAPAWESRPRATRSPSAEAAITTGVNNVVSIRPRAVPSTRSTTDATPANSHIIVVNDVGGPSPVNASATAVMALSEMSVSLPKSP